jgi:hypothetical protein
MGLISVQTIEKSPLTLSFVAASSTGADSVSNTIGFDVIFLVKNDSGSDCTVSYSATFPDDQSGYNDVSEVVATGTTGYFPLNSRVTPWSTRQNVIHYDQVTDITVAAFRILK